MKTYLVKVPVTTLMVYKINAEDASHAEALAVELRAEGLGEIIDDDYRNEDWNEVEIEELTK